MVRGGVGCTTLCQFERFSSLTCSNSSAGTTNKCLGCRLGYFWLLVTTTDLGLVVLAVGLSLERMGLVTSGLRRHSPSTAISAGGFKPSFNKCQLITNCWQEFLSAVLWCYLRIGRGDGERDLISALVVISMQFTTDAGLTNSLCS